MTDLRHRRVEVRFPELGLIARDLRAAFLIDRTLKIRPDAADVSIFNLSPDSRRKIEGSGPVYVQLFAGYRDTGLANIFSGDLRQAWTERHGPDLVTALSLGDAEQSAQQSRTNQSFAPGVRFDRVLERVIKDAKVSGKNALQKLRDGDIKGAGVTFSRGLTVSGSTHKEVARISAAVGLQATIQDAELVLLEPGKTLGAEAVLLSPESGLLGAPAIDEKNILHAVSLLNPLIRPGHQVRVQSRVAQVSGYYRVERAIYAGDTRDPGSAWTVEIEAKPL